MRACLLIPLAASAIVASADDSNIQAQVSNSVVRLLSMEEAENHPPFGTDWFSTVGVLISAAGEVVSDASLAQTTSSVVAVFPDGQRYTGTLVGSDAYSNVALFRISVSDRQPPLQGTADDVRDGDLIHSVVATTDGKRQTTTARVRQARRVVRGHEHPRLPYIEIEDNDPATPIRGPIFDERGKLVGFVTLKTRPEHKTQTALAIPIGDVARMAHHLKSAGRVLRSRLGVTLGTVPDDLAAERGLAEPMGALIVEVSKNSPGARVGLGAGDIILKVNSTLLSAAIRAPDDYSIAMERIRAGTLIQLDVLGITGQQRRVYVTTSELVPSLGTPRVNENKLLP